MLLGGDSGGPLFDFNGLVIGIHSRISSRPDQNMHVAMPAFQADWDTLMSSKVIGGRIGGNPQPDRAFLGVFTEDNEKGALVLEVREDSPAAKAGIQKDDIIQKVDDTEIKGAEALTDEIRKMKPKSKVKVTLLRDGKEKVLEVELGAR
jgi:serine protease Do